MKTPNFWKSDTITSKLLYPFGYIYNFATQHRVSKKSIYKSKLPIICVGNINVGGTGKTPTCLAIADILAANGKKISFLSRGYKSKQKYVFVDVNHTANDVGDEPLLLMEKAPVVIAPNRIIGAKMIENTDTDIIIMDDGFQNPSLFKDFSVIVIDGEAGFGNGKIFPAGPLRETIETGIKRTNAVIIIGNDNFEIKNKIKKLSNIPVINAAIIEKENNFNNKDVIAFAGIARPEKFYKSLKKSGANIIKTFNFPDHHQFSNKEIKSITEQANKLKAVPVTTKKDYVRLENIHKDNIQYLDIELKLDTTELKDIIENAIFKK